MENSPRQGKDKDKTTHVGVEHQAARASVDGHELQRSGLGRPLVGHVVPEDLGDSYSVRSQGLPSDKKE